MGFVGDIFHGIGNLLSGHSFGHTDPTSAPTVETPTPASVPVPQEAAQGSAPKVQSMTPSFLAAAATPNASSQAGAGLTSNPSGKATLGS